MKVTCVLCDQVESIDPYSLTAKKLRKRRMSTYLCQDCYDRITKKIEEKRLKKAENK